MHDKILNYVSNEMSLRGVKPSDLGKRCGANIKDVVAMFYYEKPSRGLKQAICAELGFQSWEQLTKAALADNNELLEV